jgi:hypothetical protein
MQLSYAQASRVIFNMMRERAPMSLPLHVGCDCDQPHSARAITEIVKPRCPD